MTKIIRNSLVVLRSYLKRDILRILRDNLKYISDIVSNVLYFKQDDTVFMKIFSLSTFHRCLFVRSHWILY